MKAYADMTLYRVLYRVHERRGGSCCIRSTDTDTETVRMIQTSDYVMVYLKFRLHSNPKQDNSVSIVRLGNDGLW